MRSAAIVDEDCREFNEEWNRLEECLNSFGWGRAIFPQPKAIQKNASDKISCDALKLQEKA